MNNKNIHTKAVLLENVAEIQSGNSAPKKEFLTKNKIPFVRVSDIAQNKPPFIINTKDSVTKNTAKKLNLKLFPKGSMIFPKSGMSLRLNRRAILGQDSFVVSHLCILTPKEDVDSLWLYYYMNTINMNNYCPTSNFPSIPLSTIRKIPVYLPPIMKQRRNAELLNHVTQTNSHRIFFREKLDTLILSTFIKLFGDPLNQTNFDMIKLEELGKWGTGGTPARKNRKYFSGTIPWFKAGELIDSFLTDSEEHITKQAIEDSAATLLPKGAFLIGMYDTTALRLGILKTNAACNQACAYVIFDKKIDPMYLLYALKLQKDYFISFREGIRQQNLSLTKIKNFEIPLPPEALQHKFGNIARKYEIIRIKLLQAQEKNSDLMSSLFSTLFQSGLKSIM